MKRRWRRSAVCFAAVALVSLAVGGTAHGTDRAAQHLVETYAPITMLRELHDRCDDKEEQYEPTTVKAALGNPRVALMRQAGSGEDRVVDDGPTAADIAGLGERYYLDLPGNPLVPECTYAEDFAELKDAGVAAPVTYAHIAREQGHPGFVVQYWFYYYFNVFNDLHESDWEGMQIAFDAAGPRKALTEGPSELIVFQHAGGERASWDEPKVQKEGTHPIVYPAAGSHATFYDSAVYVENGKRGSGLGCDNTTEPLRRVDPAPVLLPDEPTRSGRHPWLTYTGRWGQKEASYNNGPTGPITKTQWSEPFTWMAEQRSTSPQLPGGFAVGPTITGAFCGAVAAVSGFINLAAETTAGAIVIAAILLLLILIPIILTRWGPVELTPLRQERAFGQLLRTARQLYGRHWRTLVAIGLSSIPILGVVYGVEWVGRAIFGGGELANGVATVIAYIGQPLGFAVVGGAVITFMRELDGGQAAGFVPAYRMMFERFWRVVGGQLLAMFLVGAMIITIIGIPYGIYKFVAWQFVQQEILFADRGLREAFRGSSRIVRGQWWRTVRTAGFLWLVSVAVGPVLGFALVFTALPLIWIDVLGSVVFALMVPYVAIGRTLLYFDLIERAEETAEQPSPGRRLWNRLRPSAQPG